MGTQGAGQPASGRAGGDDRAVSPVIGMVLILAVSVLGVVAVSNWGLPAILQLKTSVEQQSVLNEFNALDASIQKLIAATTGQTTFKWQPAISVGAVDVNRTEGRWLFSADVVNNVKTTWSGVSDRDNAFSVTTDAAITDFKLRAWSWDQGASTELKVSDTNAGLCVAYGPVGSQPAGTKTLYLHKNATGCSAVNLDQKVYSFLLRQEPLVGAISVVHQAFLGDVGFVHWSSVVGPKGPQHVYHSNGVIFSGDALGYVAQSPLPVAPPRTFTNATGVESTGLFARFIKLNGTASFSAVGQGQRFSLFLDFVGTYTLGSRDNVTAVQVYHWGILREANYRAFTWPTSGYKFTELTHSVSGDKYLEHREGNRPFRFSTAYTFITVED